MSWLYSQALVAEYLEANCLDGEQFAPLNGNPIQQAYCAPDKMTDFSRLSRFGMTYKPLTENLGEELLTLYLADFHAKTLAQQEKAQELTENEAECGEKWRGSFTKYDHDTSLWKTHQCSLLEDLESFSETWPQWGLMRDGECWEQRMLEQTIRGIEFGLSERLPTPCASDYREKPTSKSWKAKGATNYSLANPEIQAKWPTPLASDWKPRGPNSKQQGLAEKVKKLPTPTAHNAKECASPSEYKRNTPTLATHAGGKLNPTWVEWLMGWPLEWTDLKPLEMGKFHCAPQQLGEF